MANTCHIPAHGSSAWVQVTDRAGVQVLVCKQQKRTSAGLIPRKAFAGRVLGSAQTDAELKTRRHRGCCIELGGGERMASARSSGSWALGLGAGAQLVILASPLLCWRGIFQRPSVVLLQEGNGCGQVNTCASTLCSDAVRIAFHESPLWKYSSI